MTTLMNDYNDLLNSGLPENGGNFSISYPYQEGDCIFIDNLAIAHRASPQAHASVS
jgi:taurine dioxygenase